MDGLVPPNLPLGNTYPLRMSDVVNITTFKSWPLHNARGPELILTTGRSYARWTVLFNEFSGRPHAHLTSA